MLTYTRCGSLAELRVTSIRRDFHHQLAKFDVVVHVSLPGIPEKGGRNCDIPFILNDMAMTWETVLKLSVLSFF